MAPQQVGVWRVIPRPGCPAPCGAIGLAELDVECAESDEHWAPTFPDSACGGTTKPSGVVTCLSKCVYVHPLLGDDTGDGSAASPVRTVGECVQRWDAGLMQVTSTSSCADAGIDLYRLISWTPFSCAQECRVHPGCTHVSIGHRGIAMRHCILFAQSCGITHSDDSYNWYRVEGLEPRARVIHKCELQNGLYSEAVFSEGREDLAIEAADRDAPFVVFDATDEAPLLSWAEGPDGVWRAPLAVPRREAILVDDEACGVHPQRWPRVLSSSTPS